MKFVAVLPILAVLIFVAGCASSSFPGTQQHLSLSQQAHFESNGYAFGASINNIALKENNRSVILTLAIENTGTRGMTVSAIPVLNDPVGQAYPGQAVFFSQIAPGYRSIQKGTITLPDNTLGQLGQGSTLTIRFQGTSPTPYEATWDVDLTQLPS